MASKSGKLKRLIGENPDAEKSSIEEAQIEEERRATFSV
jgi:hypothetical protein